MKPKELEIGSQLSIKLELNFSATLSWRGGEGGTENDIASQGNNWVSQFRLCNIKCSFIAQTETDDFFFSVLL